METQTISGHLSALIEGEKELFLVMIFLPCSDSLPEKHFKFVKSIAFNCSSSIANM
jgi:hypothetical protein